MAALLALGLWTIVSAAWSGSQASALLEADRLLLYVAAFALVALTGGGASTARWLLRLLLLALTALVVAGLLTRCFPELVGAPPAGTRARLGGPLGYHNAFGTVAAMAVVAAVWLAGDGRERAAARTLAAAAAPAAAAALYLTLSRASIVGLLVGVGCLLVLRPARTLGVLAAVVPASALALAGVAGLDTLLTTDFTSARAIDEGRRAGIAVLGAALLAGVLLLLGLAALRRRGRPLPLPRARTGWAVGVLLVFAAAGVWLAANGTGPIERAWDEAKSPDNAQLLGARASRLADPGLNGRLDHWRVSVDAFRSEPVRGTGAGTYVHEWDRHRPNRVDVVDGHSLYLELLGELGLVGLLVLLVALLVPLAVLLRRRREDTVWAGVAAVAGLWVVVAGFDWHWEMPAVTLGPIALLATGVASRTGVAGRAPSRAARLVVGVVLLVVLVLPLRVGWSQRELTIGLEAFRRGDCATAVDRALGATRALGSRPQAFELLAFCDVRLGQRRLAERMIDRAVERDPADWELRYAQGLVTAAADGDPRPALRRARTANPLEPLVQDAQSAFAKAPRRDWPRVALAQSLPGPTGRPGPR